MSFFGNSGAVGAINSILKAASGQASPAAVDSVPSPGSDVPPAVSGPSAPKLPQGAKPYAKGAGVHVPPGTATGPIVCGDSNPPPAAKEREKSLLPENVSLGLLVAEYGKSQRITTHRAILLGCLSERWIAEQLQAGTALDRATAIKRIRMELVDNKIEPKEARVDLYIRCYWVARIFSGWKPELLSTRQEANSVPFSVLRLFPILLDVEKGHWSLSFAIRPQAQSLWQRAVKENLTAAAVDAAISAIMPERKPAGKSAAVKLPKFLKGLPSLSIVELETLRAQIVEELNRRAVSEAA